MATYVHLHGWWLLCYRIRNIEGIDVLAMIPVGLVRCTAAHGRCLGTSVDQLALLRVKGEEIIAAVEVKTATTDNTHRQADTIRQENICVVQNFCLNSLSMIESYQKYPLHPPQNTSLQRSLCAHIIKRFTISASRAQCHTSSPTGTYHVCSFQLHT